VVDRPLSVGVTAFQARPWPGLHRREAPAVKLDGGAPALTGATVLLRTPA